VKTTSSTVSGPSESAPGSVAKRAGQILVMFVLTAAALFVPAGTLTWTWGWVYLGLYLLGIAVAAFFMLRRNRAAIARRSESAGMKDWDRIVAGLFTVAYFLALPLVGGLDTRFAWTSELALGFHIFGGILFVLGLALFLYAMIANAYFSTVVRVLTDQGQRVCKEGPYCIMRHPGYSGLILQSLGLPLLLGSLWALIPGGIAVVLLIIRTKLEDETLHAELKGYHRYTKQVRYRLLPGIW
jgi:protein-S-isoprenylcysteine O-methyltransferase Ste14